MKHMWVMMTYVPVEVTIEENDTIHTFTTELADEVARDEGLLGCWHCFQPLNAITYYGECPGQAI